MRYLSNDPLDADLVTLSEESHDMKKSELASALEECVGEIERLRNTVRGMRMMIASFGVRE